MKKWIPDVWSKVDNRIAYMKKRQTPNLQESRFLVMVLKQTQDKYEALSRSKSPLEWDDISKGGVTFQEFATAFDLNITNTNDLKIKLHDMIGFSYEIIFKNGDSDSFPLFMRCRFSPSTNKIWWQINPIFKDYLNPINNFFKLSIDEVSSMDSNYAILLYMFLKSKLGNTDKQEDDYSVIELREALGAENKYQQYNHFKTRVLNIARSQINQSPACKFFIEFKPIYNGKRVERINFIITDKRKEGNYYEVTNKTPNYKKNQEFRKYVKLLKHENNIVAELAKNIVDFAKKHGFDIEQRLLKMYIATLNIELEEWNKIKE